MPTNVSADTSHRNRRHNGTLDTCANSVFHKCRHNAHMFQDQEQRLPPSAIEVQEIRTCIVKHVQTCVFSDTLDYNIQRESNPHRNRQQADTHSAHRRQAPRTKCWPPWSPKRVNRSLHAGSLTPSRNRQVVSKHQDRNGQQAINCTYIIMLYQYTQYNELCPHPNISCGMFAVNERIGFRLSNLRQYDRQINPNNRLTQMIVDYDSKDRKITILDHVLIRTLLSLILNRDSIGTQSNLLHKLAFS